MEMQMIASSHIPPELILWDVIEEHFNEAEFLFGEWERALHSPVYTLTELGATLEQRLEAHLDGLLIGGPEVAKRLLEPELENDTEPMRAVVAALVLLCSEEEAVINRVLAVTQGAEGALQEALARALILSNAARLDQMVLERFREAQSDPEKAVWLEVLNGRGVDTCELLHRCFDSDDHRLVGAALEAVRRFARREMITVTERYLRSDHPHVRLSALKASLAFGSRDAWQLCLQLVEASDIYDPELLLLIAILGRPEEHQLLYTLLDNSEGVEQLLWTLGFCGTVQAGDACLPYLRSEDERVAKAAAEAISWIGGFDLNEDEFQFSSVEYGETEEDEEEETLPPLEEDDLDADLSLDGMDDLPDPNREAIAQWWEENRGRLTQHRRYLCGQPFSVEAMVHALEVGSLWRRYGVALELSIRTGGEQHVSTDTFSSRQRWQIAAVRSMSLGKLAGG
jgi:uncharacterized protein (TIGR02270 family)